LFAIVMMQSCLQTGLFEKHVTLKDHAWSSNYTPNISFDITDTASAYNIFFVVRHTDAFAFNNLWVRIKSKSPGDSAFSSQQFDLPLATQNKWTGTGMDDIFEHRILLFRRPVKFSRPGQYQFVLEHIMRENPLREVMNVGIRLEKTAQQ
jgi:gliding motility-associated lipoprotein GldH